MAAVTKPPRSEACSTMVKPLIRVINNQLDRYLKRPFRCFISKSICIRRSCGASFLFASHIFALHRSSSRPGDHDELFIIAVFLCVCLGDYEACKPTVKAQFPARGAVIDGDKL
jgi:hypothetical protein